MLTTVLSFSCPLTAEVRTNTGAEVAVLNESGIEKPTEISRTARRIGIETVIEIETVITMAAEIGIVSGTEMVGVRTEREVEVEIMTGIENVGIEDEAVVGIVGDCCASFVCNLHLFVMYVSSVCLTVGTITNGLNSAKWIT